MKARIIAATVVAVAVGAGLVAIVRDHDSTAAADETTTSTDELSLVAVEQRDLVRSEDLDGVVGHGDKRTVRVNGSGTITGLPAIDDVIQFGQRLLEVDGEPVVLLPGTRPAWRQFGAGMGKGEDVRQLEQALVQLGYADPAKVVVDDTWTSATTSAVKALQRLLGMPDDGRLDPAEVVFAPEVIRIASVGGTLGDPASGADIAATGLDQSVNVSLAASKASLLHVGDSVSIELPSGDEVAGTVQAIEDAVVDGDGGVTFPVVIAAGALDVADGVPVDVTASIVAVQNATAVPAEALLALAEGGYAVEVADEASPTGTRLVGVDVGTFADGWVEISGDITAGDQVVVP